MADVDAIVEWLAGVLDTLERNARATMTARRKPAEWVVNDWYDGQFVGAGRDTARCDLLEIPAGPLTGRGALERAVGEHIATHDPRAVLARVAAERELVDTWRQAQGWDGGRDGAVLTATMETVVEYLAWGHRHDASGYEEAWAPAGAQ